MTAEGLRSWRDVELVVEWLVVARRVRGGARDPAVLHRPQHRGVLRHPGPRAPTPSSARSIGRSVLNRVSATAVHPIEYGVVLGGLLPLAAAPDDPPLGATLRSSAHDRPLRRLLHVGIAVGSAGGGRCLPRAAPRVAGAVAAQRPLDHALRRGRSAAWRFPGWSGRSSRCSRTLQRSEHQRSHERLRVVFGVMERQPALRAGPVHLRAALLPDRRQPVPHVRRRAGDRRVCWRRWCSSAPGSSRLSPLGSGPCSHLHVTSAWCSAASLLGVAVSFVTFDALAYPMASGLTMLLVGLAGACWRLTTLDDPASPYHPHEPRTAVSRSVSSVARTERAGEVVR